MNRLFLNVGYDLSEAQLRRWFSRYGVVSDMYLPKHTSGRNKGFGFATFATEEALLLALQTQQHVVDGVLVQVKRAGPRPADADRDIQPAAATSSHVFGKGPRLYVGGVADAVPEERVRQHFGKWGNVTDVYFPGVKGQKRPNYCFVTFENYRNSQRACDQSDRQIDGWPIESISIAEDRKDDVSSPTSEPSKTAATALSDTSATPSAVQQLAQLSTAAGIPGYALWLQLQYQQAAGKLSAPEQPLPSSYPLDSPQLDLLASQRSPSIESVSTGNYPALSTAHTQSPAYTQSTGTASVHQFEPTPAQDVRMSGWGNMPGVPSATAQLPYFSAPFQELSMYNQSLMAGRPPLDSAQQLNSLALGQSPSPHEQNVSPGWGMNYSVPPNPYLGSNMGNMYRAAPIASLTPGMFMY